MEIKVLGACCRNCEVLQDNAKDALRTLGIDGEVMKVTDFKAIAGYGVMRTPALVINEKVISAGKVLTAKEIAALILPGR